ncbi:MAG: glycosyltransferase [Lentilitoribacter sp.]
MDDNDADYKSKLQACDVLICNKHLSDDAYKVCLDAKKLNKFVLYDIDDWIFEFPSYTEVSDQKYSKFKQDPIQRQKTVSRFLDLADQITVSNAELHRSVGEKSYKNILVPNGIWVEKYIKHSDFKPNLNLSNKFRILFVNADNLKLNAGKKGFISAVKRFQEENKSSEFIYIGDNVDELGEIPRLSAYARMDYVTFMHKISKLNIDFAVVPLAGSEDPEDFKFNIAKSPFKYLNYGCVGIPAIYSQGTIYDDLIFNERNGILCTNTMESWSRALLKITDPNIRAKIARESFYDVRKNHHISAAADVLEKIFMQSN